ncbi:MAG: HAMP domain-containing protein [Gemmatimonadetes bacterium]|nr:HAMP domain-containing protein [Gemmatimonadota bacterium]
MPQQTAADGRARMQPRGVLAWRLVTAFLAVTIPGTLVLGGVTFYAMHSLVSVNRELEEIGLSLEATQALHLALTQAVAPAREALVAGGNTRALQREFEQRNTALRTKLASCGAAACHGAPRSPREMAASLSPAADRLLEEGRQIFASASVPAGTASRSVARLEEPVSTASRQLQRMSDELLLRVETLRDRSRRVSRSALALTVTFTLVITLLAGTVAVLLAHRISRPVQQLLLGTRRVMAGDWADPVRVTDRGEIGELAASFNNMVQELRVHRDRLQEHSRTLEERVRERTEQLHRAREALLQSEKLASLGLLASGVAHELNNPLTSVLMNTHLLLEDVGADSPLCKYLERIDADAGRCKRIIDDLREFSRPRELRKKPSPVRSVVEQALASVRYELQRRRIEVERDVADDLPPVVWDRERMMQVLTNLFTNAAQAMPDGGRLAIRAQRQNGWLVLETRDSGPGIKAEHRSRIFDPFFTTKPDGTGLGLSICYGIVQEHKGRIEVETATADDVGAGQATGTTMRIMIPLAEEHA